MKILFADSDAVVPEIGFGCLPDSCLLRDNGHFYIPNFSSEIEAHACLVLKITRIGKYFSPEFSYRFYNGYTLAIDFRAADNPNYSTALCRGFDKSLALGAMIELPQTFAEQHVFSYNNIKKSFSTSDFIQAADKYCSKLSEFYTFKIGDFLVVSLGCIADRVSIGDVISAGSGESKLETLIQ